MRIAMILGLALGLAACGPRYDPQVVCAGLDGEAWTGCVASRSRRSGRWR